MSKSKDSDSKIFYQPPDLMDVTPEQKRKHIRDLIKLDDDLKKAIDMIFPPDAWEEFSDKEIVTIYLEKPSEGSTISQMAHQIHHNLYQDTTPSDTEADQELHLRLLIQTSLIEEYKKRKETVEKPEGRTALDYLVHHKQDEKSFDPLMNQATKVTWKPQSVTRPGSATMSVFENTFCLNLVTADWMKSPVA